jgi:hypothetical protein
LNNACKKQQTMNITGTWQGTIVYGNGYNRLYKFKELYFDVDLSQEEDKIRGIAKDTGGQGVNISKATINGTFKNSKIKFIKQYQVRQYITKEGPVRDEKSKGPKIQYQGKYNAISRAFNGSWSIKVRKRTFFIFYKTKICEGTWFMKLKDNRINFSNS